MTWNARGLMSSTMCLANLLREYDCDFVVLSEHKLPPMYSKYLNSVDNNYLSFTKCESQTGNELHGKAGISILLKKSFIFSVRDIAINSSRIVAIECNVNTNELLYIVGAYLPPENNMEAYKDELSMLQDFYNYYSRYGHIVIAGDFNASCLELDNEKCNLYKSRELRNFVKRNHLDHMLGDDKAPECKYTFTGTGTMLDYIFSDTHMYMSLSSYEILGEGTFSSTSDHLPVLAVYNIHSNQHHLTELTNKIPAWHKISNDSKQIYEREVTHQLEKVMGNNVPETLPEINEFCVSFVKCITTSANTVIPKSKFNPHSKPYWSREVKEAHAQERRMRSIWVRNGRPRGMHHISYFNYKRAKRRFRKCQSLAFEQYIKKTYADIDSAAGCDTRLFWKLISRQRPRQSRVYPEIEYGSITANTPQSVADVFATYFEIIYAPKNNNNYDEENLQNINKLYDIIKSENECDKRLEYEISESEVNQAVNSLKLRKAPGIDGIQAEHLKYGGHKITFYLCKLFCGIIKCGMIPTEWKKGIIVPIYKGDNKIKNSPDSYRPVSLLSCLLKVFEKILHNRISDAIISEIRFPNPQQQGFQKDLSCITAGFNLQETISHYIDHGSSVYVAFLDSKKAYDTVWRKALMVKLYKLGLNGKIWKIIDDCHIGNESTVAVNGTMSQWFEIKQGVRQGGVLSGFLYCVFINDLLNCLESVSSNFGVYNVKSTNPTLADDIACLSSSPTSLQKMLNVAFKYSCLWRFSFNAQKSSVVIFGKGRPPTQQTWKLGDDEILINDSYKHLGIIQHSRFKTIDRTTDSCNKGRKAYFAIRNDLSHNTNPLTLVKLYRKIVLPTVLYGCELWNNLKQTDFQILNKFQHFVTKDIQGMKISTRSDMCESMIGLHPIISEIDKRKLVFFGKLCKLDTNSLSKNIFLFRLYDLLQGDIKQFSGFLKDIYEILIKYNLLQYLRSFVEVGQFPGKKDWKYIVKQSIHHQHTEEWRNRMEADPDFRIFKIFHNIISPIKLWKFDFSFDEVPLIRFLAKLWTIPPIYLGQTCRVCQETYDNQYQHAVLGCPSTTCIRDSFFDNLINNFDVHLYVELSQLSEDILYFILLGGVEPTILLEKESKKEFICLCAKFVCGATACYNRALSQNLECN